MRLSYIRWLVLFEPLATIFPQAQERLNALAGSFHHTGELLYYIMKKLSYSLVSFLVLHVRFPMVYIGAKGKMAPKVGDEGALFAEAGCSIAINLNTFLEPGNPMPMHINPPVYDFYTTLLLRLEEHLIPDEQPNFINHKG